MVDENIIWALEGEVKDAKSESFTSLKDEMINAVSKESGVLNYEWTLGDDGKTLHVYERYENAKIAKAHLHTWGMFAGRFMSEVAISKITVYSDMDEELKRAFSGAIFMQPIGGFKRR